MDLAARLDTLLWDAVLNKPRYGARSELISSLIRNWCDEQEDGSIPGEPEVRPGIEEGASIFTTKEPKL
jgi:hypothetical protein